MLDVAWGHRGWRAGVEPQLQAAVPAGVGGRETVARAVELEQARLQPARGGVAEAVAGAAAETLSRAEGVGDVGRAPGSAPPAPAGGLLCVESGEWLRGAEASPAGAAARRAADMQGTGAGADVRVERRLRPAKAYAR